MLETPSGTAGSTASSPDPLNDSTEMSMGPPMSSAARRVPRSHRSSKLLSLDGRKSIASTFSSPRKQTFHLDVGSGISPQKIRVTVEADSEKTDAAVSRRLFADTAGSTPKAAPRRRPRASSSAAPPSSVKSTRKAITTTTTKVPVRGLSDDEGADLGEFATPKRRRGRPRRSGTPMPTVASVEMRASSTALETPSTKTPVRGRRARTATPKLEQPGGLDPLGSSSTQKTPRAAGKMPKRTAGQAALDSEADLVTGSQPRKRGRPRRRGMTPDEMAVIAERNEREMEASAAHDAEVAAASAAASATADDDLTDRGQSPADSAMSPGPATPLSSVDLVKVQAEAEDASTANSANEDEATIVGNGEPAGLYADEADLMEVPVANNTEDNAVFTHAYAESEDAASDHAFAGYDEPDYANDPADYDFGEDVAPAQIELTEALDGINASVDSEPSPMREHTNTATPVARASEPAPGSRRSDPFMPPPSSASPRPNAASYRSTQSDSDGEVDTVIVGAIQEAKDASRGLPMDEGAFFNIRGQDTIAMGEDFSMIGMDSLQASVNMSHSDLPEMGEMTSRIISRTLESLRHGDQNDANEASGLNILDLIGQSDPTSSRPASSSANIPAEASPSHAEEHSPQVPASRPAHASSPASQAGSPKKKAEPLSKLLARKSVQEAHASAATDFQQPEDRYDDSFSEIPESVLEAAIPEATNTAYFSQQQAELTGRVDIAPPQPRVADRRYSYEEEQAEDVDDASQEMSILESNHPPVQSVASSSNAATDYAQQEADFTSSPPVQGVPSQQQGDKPSLRNQSFTQQRLFRTTPAVFMSPRSPPVPHAGSSGQMDRLMPPLDGYRPSLSPIVRAGRALQSVTSDPPSPRDSENYLRSPFRRSVGRETQSPAAAPQDDSNSPDAKSTPSRSAQPPPVQPDVEAEPVATPPQPSSATSRPVWSVAFAPLSGIKNLVVAGAQMISPRPPLPSSSTASTPAPPIPAPAPLATTISAAKRTADAANLEAAGLPEASPSNKRRRLSSTPGSDLNGQPSRAGSVSGSETGRSWRSRVFREGGVASSISGFASKLMSRHVDTASPQVAESDTEMLDYSVPADVATSEGHPSSPRVGHAHIGHSADVSPSTPSRPASHNDDLDDLDDDDIWAIEAARPTPRRVAKPAPEPPVAQSTARGETRNPRLSRLAATQMMRNAWKLASQARQSLAPEEAEETDREFSLLDTEIEPKQASLPGSSARRPGQFNLDDFFSSPVAIPKMLPPTSEQNIQFNEQSRQQAVQRLLEHNRERNVRGTREDSGPKPAQRTTAEASSDAGSDSDNIAQAEAVGEASHDASFYAAPISSALPAASSPRADKNASREQTSSPMDRRTTPISAKLPRQRRMSKSQLVRMDFVNMIRGASAGPSAGANEPVSEPTSEPTSEPVSEPASESLTSQPVFSGHATSTPAQKQPAGQAAVFSSSSTAERSSNDHSVLPDGEMRQEESPESLPEETLDESPSEMRSRRLAPAQAMFNFPQERPVGQRRTSTLAAFQSVFFEEAPELRPPDNQTHAQRQVEEDEQEEPSYVESESSFLTPVLKPLPDKAASPTKSCMRSPTKLKTPGRVVEFTSSTMAAEEGEGASILEERASAQQAALRFAEHFGLDTNNRVAGVSERSTPANADGNMGTMEAKEASTMEDDAGTEKGYEVDEELSDMMLSDAHQISLPKPYVYAHQSPAGQAVLHPASIARPSRWQPPVAQAKPPSRSWGLEDWLSMNEMVQEYRTLGPLNFKLRYKPRGRTQALPPGPRPSQALLSKVVHTRREGMLVKDWHLDIVDAYHMKAGRIWREDYLLRRLFSLFIGESRRGVFTP